MSQKRSLTQRKSEYWDYKNDGPKRALPKPFLTPKEVAGVLGLNIYTVYGLLRNSELKGIKLRPKAWRIKKEALDAYLESKEAGGTEKRVKNFLKNLEV